MHIYTIYHGTELEKFGFQAKCLEAGNIYNKSVWQIIPQKTAVVRLLNNKIMSIVIDGNKTIARSTVGNNFVTTSNELIRGYYGLSQYQPIAAEYAPDINPQYDQEFTIKDIYLINAPMEIEFRLEKNNQIGSWETVFPGRYDGDMLYPR